MLYLNLCALRRRIFKTYVEYVCTTWNILICVRPRLLAACSTTCLAVTNGLSPKIFSLPQGLSAKTAKAGALPPVQLLLAPETHFQWNTIKHLLLSLWTSVRAQGTPVVVALVTACSVLGIWAIGDDIEEYFPGAAERVLEVVCSVPGGAVIRRAGAMILIVVRLVGGATGSVVLVVNPFQGAGDALRLQPVKVGVCWVFVLGSLVVCTRHLWLLLVGAVVKREVRVMTFRAFLLLLLLSSWLLLIGRYYCKHICPCVHVCAFAFFLF